jgi:hypothetical protein
MNTPEPESDRERNIRFKNAISDKFKCTAICKDVRGVSCDLRSFAKGDVLEFDLSPPKEYPDAKKCFVWDSKNFKPDDSNSVVMVLDVQVTSDPNELPYDAVWAWLSGSLVKDPDIYVKSEKWSKEKLHGEQVEFRTLPDPYKCGRFFVRERSDKSISVRIVEQGEICLNNKTELVDVSSCLTLPQVEKIEPRPPGVGYFSLSLP